MTTVRWGTFADEPGQEELMVLTQAEADRLIAMDKVRLDDTTYTYPLTGRLQIPLNSVDHKEDFFLDIARGRINLKKSTHQLRGRVTIILIRVDIEGPSHQNPDGVVIPCPHVHLYQEDFDDKWAYPLPPEFDPTSRPVDIYYAFLKFCNVTKPPKVLETLFDAV